MLGLVHVRISEEVYHKKVGILWSEIVLGRNCPGGKFVVGAVMGKSFPAGSCSGW